MKNSMYLLVAVAVAFLFFINVGCTSETNVPSETSEKTTVTPSGTADPRDGKAAMTETNVPKETNEKTTAMPSGTTDVKDDKAAMTETNIPKETSEKTTAMTNGTTDLKDGDPAMTETKLTNESGETTPGQMAETTPGQMAQTMSESGNDASITAQVEAALLENPLTSARSATVETKDGVVTLNGQAQNAAEKEVVANLVKDIPGVKNVVNNMTVQ